MFVVVLSAACAHERVEERSGCWIARSENRWGDTRERIAACRPPTPRWSNDPLVRAIEDCLHQAQLAQYQRAARGIDGPLKQADEVACLQQAEKLALQRIDSMKAQLATADARARKLEDENRELRQTLVACVEKSPNAIAEARATTESSSDIASSQHHDHQESRKAGRPAARRRSTPPKGTAPPSITPTGGGCPPVMR
jgi:hypothetical protein